MTDIISTAIELGLCCFPCRENKAPAAPGGFKSATRDPEQIREIWKMYPGPLIGIATGFISGFDVLDIDAMHGGGAWYAAHKTKLPPTRIHRTRSGGLHVLFRHLDGLRNSAGKIAPGVDVRADGGYIIWWPATGLAVQDYPASGAPEWPFWLLPSLLPKPVPPPVPYPRRTLGNAPRKLDGVLRVVLNAPNGERNSATHWAACRIGEMVKDGEIAAALAMELIAEAASRAGLSRAEALPTIRSGVRAGGGRG